MNSMRAIQRIACLLFCFALLALGARAQNTGGTISGTVADKTGAVIPGVTVTATNEATNVVNTVQTNSSGAYSFLTLPVGTYDVEAKQTGFQNYKQTGIALNVNDHITVDVAMEVGTVSQTVEVSANAAHVETSTATLGDVIGGKSIVDQPLVSRSYIDLMGLQAGVNPSTNASGRVSGNLSAGNVSVSGSRADANGFTVNGGNVEEGQANGTSIIPNADSIAEFRIITNSANAEYGHYSGGAVSVITKSGSNSFHGDAFEFWRNQNMDAIQPFSNTKGAYSQNQFGGTIGGPIKHNRLFFFGDYQGTRETTGSVDTVDVPSDGTVPNTSNELAGDLSDRLGPNSAYDDFNGSVSNPNWASILQSRLGYAVTQGEPYYSLGCTSSAACVFPNGIIPKSAWAPPAAGLLKYVPAANGVQGGLPIFQTTSAKSTLKDNKGSARIDATTGIGQLSFYYFLDNSSTLNPYAGGNLPGFAAQTPARAQQYNFGDVKTFGGNQLNDFKLNFTRTSGTRNKAIGGIGPSYASLGFVAGGNGLVASNPTYAGVPQFSTNEFSGGEVGSQVGQIDNTFQLSDAYSMIKGNHQIKFGGEGNYVQIIERRVEQPNGNFSFDGTETGDSLADYLIGAVDSFTQASNQVLDSRAWYYGAFVQDTWRIKPSLTLNYGLRQDVSTFWYDTQNKIQAIVPGLNSQVYPGSPTGWVFPGDPGVPRTLAPTRYNNFAPRVAFAYSPNFTDGFLGKLFGSSGHTAIRGAWGVFYTVVDDGTLFTEVADAPFGLYWQVPAVQFATPWVSTKGQVYGQHFPFTIPAVGDKNIDWSFFEPISSSPGVDINNRLPYT
ncbi:MAG: carboxypeptidase regulatory-like domain-containing protein [Candidatus Acidiferrales bacterium]